MSLDQWGANTESRPPWQPEDLIVLVLRQRSAGGFRRHDDAPAAEHPYNAHKYAKNILGTLDLHGWMIVRKHG